MSFHPLTVSFVCSLLMRNTYSFFTKIIDFPTIVLFLFLILSHMNSMQDFFSIGFFFSSDSQGFSKYDILSSCFDYRLTFFVLHI
jgi:hypothetical protein